jgi:CHASE2 domain-containing sensor protein
MQRCLKHALHGLAASAVLIGATLLFEHTDLGFRAEFYVFEKLEGLMPATSATPLPVVVVDISSIPRIPRVPQFRNGESLVTQRAPLHDALAAIAQKHPRAIALDVDMSPDENGWMDLGDPDFFRDCQAIRRLQKVPVSIAVYRTRDQRPEQWLGSAQYEDLAAGGAADGKDTRRVPVEFESGDRQHPLPSLGLVLARRLDTELPGPSWWLTALLQHDKQRLVNYSKLDLLKAGHKTLDEAMTIDPSNQLKDKIVLLGDVRSPGDQFIFPGMAKPQPGVYLMALATYTLAVEPVFEFTHPARVALDALISLVIVFGLYRICGTESQDVVTRHKRRRIFLYSTTFAVFVLGLALVYFCHVIWFDFIAVLAALLVHPGVEKRVARWWRSLRVSHENAA